MFDRLNVVATAVFVFFFALVTVVGFLASRWRRGDLNSLGEWGLGGRQFGPWVTWFLLGGDLYTAYTVIAVPALIYGIGAYGFFAVPYTIVIYPFLYLTMPRLWAVTHKRGYLTAADFVFGRYGFRPLELAVAMTGIVATMPYIALQLVGLEKVIGALGFSSADVAKAPQGLFIFAEIIASPFALVASIIQGQNFFDEDAVLAAGFLSHLPITIAFVILALYTYKSGLRAPAMIAFVKDLMIYVFIIAAVIAIPYQLGGWAKIFSVAQDNYAAKVAAGKVAGAGLTLAPGQIVPYMTLALGSAMALFMYPHALTGTLAASSGRAIRLNTMTLPAYSFVLGLIALLGMMALAAGVKVGSPQDAVPQLVLWAFPDWFAGFCFSAIALGALVPAAVMSIGAANTFTRNIWKPFIHPAMTDAEESVVAKLVSLIVKVGALLVIFFMPTQFALDLQLLGGVWMIQIFPALVFGLFTRWFGGGALFVGWLVGMFVGTSLSWTAKAWVPVHKLDDLPFLGPIETGLHFAAYNGITAVLLNLLVAAAISLAWRSKAPDQTLPEDYLD